MVKYAKIKVHKWTAKENKIKSVITIGQTGRTQVIYETDSNGKIVESEEENNSLQMIIFMLDRIDPKEFPKSPPGAHLRMYGDINDVIKKAENQDELPEYIYLKEDAHKLLVSKGIEVFLPQVYRISEAKECIEDLINADLIEEVKMKEEMEKDSNTDSADFTDSADEKKSKAKKKEKEVTVKT